MIFTGSPQSLNRVPISKLFLTEAQQLASLHNIQFSNCSVHAPYIFNLASVDDDGYIKNLLVEEIRRTVSMGIRYFIVHPGYAVDNTIEKGIFNIAKNISKALDELEDLDFILCLETMAGKSNQVGGKLEDLREIFKLVK
ncbi:hypothetical protein PVNG_02389 [Plasmodium vivax North Korean]|uniref:Xylose isomerase-like TIM barrel domain-containing protein n=1 Tax=Plasmodium vivax North Korean TaxID=1035514 RepID=A0A0J9TM54_PLAVI|nr:hypothetical protein PVNG_02389 [Plasmodium vivax North Korean]